MLFTNKKKIIQELSDWLYHPNEMGIRPKQVTYIRAYKANFIGIGKEKIHLLSYEMPDGIKGRGFVNPITWSFIGSEINEISDDSLIVAYCGWAWLFSGIQQNKIEVEFQSSREKSTFKKQLLDNGFNEVKFKDSYLIGDSEIYEFNALKSGEKISGAGNTEDYLFFDASSPEFHLQPVYFLLGRMMI